jgi:tetratricopeptide (TPR) repeat protein
MLLVATAVSVSYAVQAKQASKEAFDARDDANVQKNAAVAAQALSDKRLKQSRVDFDRALKSLDTIVTEVSSAEFAQLPGVERVRDEILEKAMKFYQEIIDEHNNDPFAREKQALAHHKIANIHAGKGDDESVLRELNESVRLLEELIRENPNEMHFQSSLVTPLCSRLHCQSRTPEQRLADAERCVDIVKRCDESGLANDAANTALLYYKVAEKLPTDSPRARQLVEASIQLTESHGLSPVPPTQIWFGDRANESGDFEAAVKYLQRGIELYDAMGSDLRKRDRYIERWLSAVDTAKLGTVYEKLEQKTEAESAYRSAFASARQLFTEYHENKLFRDACLARGIQLIDFLNRQGQTVEAIKQLDELQLDFPASESLHLKRARYAETLEQFDIALEHYDKAALVAPNDYYVLRDRSLFFIRRADRHATLVELNKTISLFPKQWWLLKRRADIHFQLGNPRDALSDLTQALDLRPDDVSSVSWILAEKIAACPDPEFREGMIKLADRCVELNNASAASLIERAQLLAALGELEKAKQDLTSVLSSDAGQYYPHYQSALLSAKLDDLA